MDITYLLHVLWRKKRIIIAVPLISVIAAIIFTHNLKPSYKAKTQIATGFTVKEGVNIMDEGFSIRDAEMKFNNLMASMNSGTMINMVSYRLILEHLQENKLNSKDLKKQLSNEKLQLAKRILREKLANFQSITVNDSNIDLLEEVINTMGYTFQSLKNELNITRIAHTDYIEVTYESNNAELSADAVNLFIEEFLRFYVTNKKETSSESVVFMKELVERKKEELDNKTKAMQTFKANNNLVSSQPKGETQLGQVYALESQRDEINNKIYGFRLRLENLKTSLAEKTGSSNRGSSANQRIIDLKKKIDIMNERFISNGSNNADLLDSLNLLRQQYKMELSMMEKGGNLGQESGMTTSELDEAIKNTQIDIRVEQSRLGSINSKIYELRGSMSGYASNEAILNTLERDLKVASDEYLSAVNKFNDAQNKLLAASGTIRQLYKAPPPASPEPSMRLLIIAFSGFASMSIILFVIIIIELFDSSIKTSEQYHKKVGLSLAGTLVKVDTTKLSFPSLFRKKQHNTDLELFKHFLRKIRFEIENSGGKIFIITSPKEGDGKTFFTFSLAFVLSMVKKRVLIIDTNFKNNTLTKWLVVSKKNLKYIDQRSNGTYELSLLDKGNDPKISNPETNFVTQTKYKNIYIIGNSGGYESPEEIFHNRDFNSLLKELAKEFDYILMEGPSLNEYSDTKELIKYVDKVIPVFSAESSIKQMDKESIEFLGSLKGKLTGGVLNMIDAKNLNV